jgi:predicted permease
MDWFRELGRRLWMLFRRRQFDADLDEEMRLHRQWREQAEIERGLSPKEAHHAVLRRFGNELTLREESRDMWGWNWLESFLQDMRYGLRQLARNPGFAAVSILILAVAIGANIAVFSVVNTLLLRPLPFPDSRELVWIAPPPSTCGRSCATFSADGFEEFRAQNRAYQDVTGYEAFTTPDNVRLTGRGEPESATSIEVIGNFFQVLGVQPAMGRLFAADEVRGGPHPVALLTNAYWRREFMADPAIVGKAVEMSGAPVTIVGVLPASFDFGAVFSPGAKVDLFTPLDLNLERHWGNIVTLLGRLRPGVTLGQALDDGARVAPDIYQDVKSPETRGVYKGAFIPVSLRDYATGKLRRSLIALWCAVGAILLIAGVNLSNLVLARASGRAKEFAVRGALGAGRGRIVHQLLIESLLLSGAGAALGVGLAWVFIGWLARQGTLALPLLSSLRIDSQALGWTVLISFLTALLFGVLPGLRMAGGNLQEVLKDSGPGAGLGRKHERIRATLVISEVALASMLLVSAGLLLRSFVKVLDVDLGFQPDRAASIQIDYDDSAPSNDARQEKRGAIFQQIVTRVSALPGVEAAGIADFLPLGPNREWDTPVPKGKSFPPGELPEPLVYVISPGFIRAMGIRLHGRDFTWADGPRSERVVLINASAARIYWPGEEAVGKILMCGKEEDRVVGVVDDVHEESVESGAGAQIYYPATQQQPDWAQLVIRTSLPPSALAPSVLRALRELNPKQPAAEFRPLRTIVDRAVSPRRFFMLLVAAFAGLGLLLAALGIYGVVSYLVGRRTHEIGIRMALGARPRDILGDLLGHGGKTALAGVALGLVASLGARRLITSMLFGVSATDPLTYAAVVLILLSVALLACWIPARRATKVDPMAALRYE